MLFCTYDQSWDRHLAMQAMAALNTALWDAFGRLVGQPLYRIWDGYRDAMPVIGIGGYYGHSEEEICKEVQFFIDQGFAGMKFKIGGMSPQEGARRLRLVRDFAGPDFI
jgi:L-alanine-DL-glutamate epimerase-like enolase superfamily enzyme